MNNKKPNIGKALLSLRPNAEFVVRGTEIDWLDKNQTQPSDSEIQAKLTELQADYNSKQYQRDRAVAYDSIPEQLDQIYHDMDGWKAKVKAVKDKYPKPS